MGKLIGCGIYIIVALSGLLQFFLLPGLIWNVCFPFLQVLLLAFAVKLFRRNKVIKYSTLLLGMVVLFEIGFSVYSNLNIESGDYDKELTLMSYNLFFKNARPDQSISIIRQEDPDILLVQELTPNWAAKIEKEIGADYPHKLTHALRGTHGIGIYSKYKITNQELLKNAANLPFAQIVDLQFDGKLIQLVNTHLASPAIAVENKDNFLPLFLGNYKLRTKQIKALNGLARNGGETYSSQLLIGDLNTLHSEPIFKRLKWQWVNSSNGLFRWTKFNFPHSSRVRPILTLDYILGRGAIEFLEYKVIEGGSSDHLAIVAKIAF